MLFSGMINLSAALAESEFAIGTAHITVAAIAAKDFLKLTFIIILLY
jgi:hypothetical protein